MSSIFSDPHFRRGSTLLGGEPVEVDLISGAPLAGNEIVGSIKVFQDVNPTGTGQRYSNRLVYCVAVRYLPTTLASNPTPSSLSNSGGADAGKLYVLSRANGLFTFDGTVATPTDIANGRLVGVLDEYLKMTIRPYDVVWMVVKGPATVKKDGTAVIAPGAPVEAANALGVAQTSSTFANFLGQAIDPAAQCLTTAAALSGATSIAVTFPTLALPYVVAGAPVVGTNIASNTVVAANGVNSTATTGALTTATITLDTATSGAVASGASILIGGALKSATTCRINMFSNEF